MSLVIVFFCIALLVLFISYFKINAFLSFLVISLLAGLLLGNDASAVSASVQQGIGDMLGALVVVVICGAMLGKLVAESGAAQRITNGLMKIFGEKRFRLALMTTGFIIGIPLFYNVGFVLVFPLICSVAYRFKLSPVYVGIPMLASLSVTHGFLPPHPSPTALVAQFHADMGKTMLYGVAIAIPTVVVAGLLFSKTLKNLDTTVLKTYKTEDLPQEKLPGSLNSFLSALLPVLLLAIATIVNPLVDGNGTTKKLIILLSDPSIVMIISLAYATYAIGLRKGLTISYLMSIYADAVKDVGMILLIMGGAGALKQVLMDSGISTEIANLLGQTAMHPLLLGWLLACVIRVCVGSATVAGLTAAGIVAPFVTQAGVNAELMVLAIGAGSLMFSHVNDAGFWLFKEYFNLSIRNTIRSWSLMETIVAVVGLVGVMLLSLIV